MSRPRSPEGTSRERRGSEDLRVRWRVDHEKSVLLSNFERRSWPRSVEDGEWNFYWASPHSVKQIFNPENNIRLADQQVLNHFPNHYELTRKDLMVKNLKRYKKELERVNAERAAESGCAAAELDLECIPATFILPNDFSLFAEEFRKQEHAGRQMWIMKPCSGSRGIGIFIISRLSQVRKWDPSRLAQGAAPKQNYVVSRYIADPHVSGRQAPSWQAPSWRAQLTNDCRFPPSGRPTRPTPHSPLPTMDSGPTRFSSAVSSYLLPLLTTDY